MGLTRELYLASEVETEGMTERRQSHLAGVASPLHNLLFIFVMSPTLTMAYLALYLVLPFKMCDTRGLLQKENVFAI